MGERHEPPPGWVIATCPICGAEFYQHASGDYRDWHECRDDVLLRKAQRRRTGKHPR